VTDRDGLGVDAAAFDDHIDIVLVDEGDRLEGGEDRVLKFDRWKIIFKGARIDDDLAAAFSEPDS